jgi:beta-galactosidase
MDTNKTVRRKERFDASWRFCLGDIPDGHDPALDDGAWRALNLPHDWSIEGEFREDHPSGWGGGYLPGGIGWYRKSFRLAEEERGRAVSILFDGVYKNCDVYLNGQHLGFHPYGYTSFHYDLTPHLHYGERENVLAVRVDDSTKPDSRWFSGSGIYRHVWLVVADPLHVPIWGAFVRTHKMNDHVTRVDMLTQVRNDAAHERRFTLETRILDPQGQVVAEHAPHPAAPRDLRQAAAPGETVTLRQRLFLHGPQLWSDKAPAMYTAQTLITVDGALVDSYETPFGVREICFDADQGFLLNGERIKIKGVCLHHDGGCVGAAVPDRVWERRLELLKEMGCNGIRSSHYPPSPEFLDMCDRMGFLVMDEICDEWRIGKVPYGYHKYFDEWHEADMLSMLHRDRNHPSIVLWSVGNEIPEQSWPEGVEVLRRLVEIVHAEDPSRPTTSACDNISAPSPATLEFLDLLDVVGYNYVDRWYEHQELYYGPDRHLFPQRRMIGSENSSLPGIRGDYTLEPGQGWWGNYYTRMINVEQLWKYTAMHDYVAGDYMWTGIDYLGEARWPHRNSVSGVIDLCGFPKDGFYFFQSQWTEEPVLYLAPHWSWEGQEGRVIPVICYTNCETVELFLNGRSCGTKSYAFPRPGMEGLDWSPRFNRPRPTTADLHLAWDVPYEPGVLKAVGRKGGEVICECEVATAGAPARLEMSADRAELCADGCDVAHLTVRVVDAQGRTVPNADNSVRFSIQGPAQILATDNGNPACHDSFLAPERRAFHGLCLGIVQMGETAGEIVVRAEAEGLAPAVVALRSRAPGA